jgi:hypothetical protein
MSEYFSSLDRGWISIRILLLTTSPFAAVHLIDFETGFINLRSIHGSNLTRPIPTRGKGLCLEKYQWYILYG